MDDSAKEFVANYKIILLGDSGVGKTSIISRYVKNEYFEGREPTIGVGFGPKYLTVDGESIKLSIWDTAGQEKYRTITKSYYRNVDGVVLVFSIAEPVTLEHLTEFWIKELTENGINSVPILLIGNKHDLREGLPEDQVVSREQADAAAKQCGSLFVEASAKTAEQVEQAFGELVEKIREGAKKPARSGLGGVALDSGGPVEQGWCC
jgi:Ras-related protein Rab-18